jgi:hypothetical protein
MLPFDRPPLFWLAVYWALAGCLCQAFGFAFCKSCYSVSCVSSDLRLFCSFLLLTGDVAGFSLCNPMV